MASSIFGGREKRVGLRLRHRTGAASLGRLALPVLLLAILVAGLYAIRHRNTFQHAAARLDALAGLPPSRLLVLSGDPKFNKSVQDALGYDPARGILSYPIGVLRDKVNRLAFAEDSTVQRRLPDTIVVQVKERKPVAIWQQGTQFVLIDHDGQVVGNSTADPGGLDKLAGLLLVVGRGAPEAAAQLETDLGTAPAVRDAVIAATRIDRRRWDLTLRNSCVVRLPEGDEARALSRLTALEASQHVLERPLEEIDMRMPDRLILRPRSTMPDGENGVPAGADPAKTPSP